VRLIGVVEPTAAFGNRSLADVPTRRDHRKMIDAPALSQPHVRRQLQTYVSELQAADPRTIWRAERESGLASGIDEVFHFFFDDNDFDDGAIGDTLTGAMEVRLIGALKDALGAVLDAAGDADDSHFVTHPLWSRVRQAATAASTQVAGSANGS
jgi:hypothetical protein